MGGENFADFLAEIKATRDELAAGDNARDKVLRQVKADVDRLALKVNRPGQESFGDDAERKAAIGLLQLKHSLKIPKRDPQHEFSASEDAISEAKAHISAIKAMMKVTDVSRLPDFQRKALSNFSFGANGFLLPVEMSDRILSYLTGPTDITALMDNVIVSGSSIKFLVDNVDLDVAAWACQTTCFANNPQPNLQEGLGELEIKPETLRYIVCATTDTLEDSGFDIESWLLNKVSRAFRRTVSEAVMTGSGVGMPQGILQPQSGIPVCDTAAGTAAGTIGWQDLVMLRFQVPMQYWDAATSGYLMNQNTAGLLFSMTDGNGRPILTPSLQDPLVFTLLGSPLKIATQMPDVAPTARRSRCSTIPIRRVFVVCSNSKVESAAR